MEEVLKEEKRKAKHRNLKIMLRDVKQLLEEVTEAHEQYDRIKEKIKYKPSATSHGFNKEYSRRDGSAVKAKIDTR